MIQHVNISRLYDTRRTAVSVDPFIEIGYGVLQIFILFTSFLCVFLIFKFSNLVSWTHSVLNISEIRFKVSMAMSPSQRPRGVLGFWSSLMTALGNTENMPVSVMIYLY